MVKVECIIRPEKVSNVKSAISSVGVHGMTVTEVIGCGLQKGHPEELNWNTELNINLLPKTKIETVVPEEKVSEIVSAIIGAAKTGEIGDGKIFLSPVTEAIRIRTGETGKAAV